MEEEDKMLVSAICWASSLVQFYRTSSATKRMNAIVIDDYSPVEDEGQTLRTTARKSPLFYAHIKNAMESLRVESPSQDSDQDCWNSPKPITTHNPGPLLPVYQLVGIVAHSGQVEEGHYTSFIRHPTVPLPLLLSSVQHYLLQPHAGIPVLHLLHPPKLLQVLFRWFMLHHLLTLSLHAESALSQHLQLGLWQKSIRQKFWPDSEQPDPAQS